MSAHIVSIGHVMLRTSDCARAVAFYREVVGLKLVVATTYFNAFELGDVHLCIVPGKPRVAAFDLTTNDVEGFRQRLRQAGVACSGITTGAYSGHTGFSFSDPDGHEIAVTNVHVLMSEVAP
jgi:catechol 2,3-dioxygenase-like lactoylglutathione lyase family enzyme